METSSWSKREGAVAGVDYPLQPPAGWGGVSSNPRPAGTKAAVALSDEDRQGEWKAFERRPVSPAEAKAFREVVISRRASNRARSSGGEGGQGFPLVSPTFSSDCSESTSRVGALEDNGSLMRSIADTSSEGSLFFPEELRSTGGRKMPKGESANAPKTWSKGVEQHRKENQITSGRHVAALDNDRDTESVWSTSASSTEGTITPTNTPELRLVQQDNDRHLLHASGGIRSGGESQPSVLSNLLAPPKESPLAPSSGLGLDSGPVVNTESAFRLSCEADADDVLRAMVRLSIASTPTGRGSLDATRQSQQGYSDASARVGVDERAGRRRRGNGAAAPQVPARYLLPAEGGSGGICRGSTPGIKSGHLGNRKPPYGNETACPPDEKNKVLDIEGRMLRSGGGARSAGHLPQGRNQRLVATPDNRRNTTREFSGRRTAPQHGKRPNHRGTAATEAAERTQVVLSESQSAPTAISQYRSTPSVLLKDDSGRRVGTGNGGGGTGGMAALESALRGLSANAPSTSGASRQPSSSSAIFDRKSAVHDAGDSKSDDRERGSSSHSRVPIVGVRYRGSKLEKPSVGGTDGTVRFDGGQKEGGVGAKTGNEGGFDDGSSTFIGPIDPEASVTQSSCLTFGEGGDGASVACDDHDGYCDESDDKTTGDQMSMIIAKVTRDAAASVLSAEGILTTEASLVTEEAEQLLSPAEGVGKKGAGTAAGAGAEESSRLSPLVTESEHLNQEPPRGDTTKLGKEQVNTESRSRGKTTMTGLRAKSNERKTKTASKPHDSRQGAEDRSGRGGVRGDKSGSLSVGSSSAPAKLRPEQEAPKDRRSSLRLSKETGPASGRGNTGEEMFASCVTDRAVTAGPPVDRSQGRGGGPEEASPADNNALAKAEGATEKETGIVQEVQTTKSPLCQVDASGKPSGRQTTIETKGNSRSNAKRSQRGQDSSRGNRSNNAGRAASIGGGSPSSQGSSVVSRGSTRSGSHARGTESMESTGSGRNSRNVGGPTSRKDTRKGGRTDSAASTKVSLPALAKSEATKTAKDGAQQQQQQDDSVAEKIQDGRATQGSETVDVQKQLPRISSGAAASGGRIKTASAAAGKATPHKAITVHKRPTRAENEDLFTTTEALTTHHLTVEELLKVHPVVSSLGCF